MIFIDVDGTQVLYRDDQPVCPYGPLMGLGFEVNHELADRILQYRKPGEIVVVWSGGGADYAHAVVAQYIPRLDKVVFGLKDLSTLKWLTSGDIVVDDDAGVRARAKAMGAQGLNPHEEWLQSP